ncbi:hypothetical protein [Kordiimonas sp.]|uniref:hypothetical protein n=1 Tax=Kordiimonas sp. TaxID=1970157 RepID=UPI003A8FA6F3
MIDLAITVAVALSVVCVVHGVFVAVLGCRVARLSRERDEAQDVANGMHGLCVEAIDALDEVIERGATK